MTTDQRAGAIDTIRQLAAEAGDVDPDTMSDDEILDNWDVNHSACVPPHISSDLADTIAIIAARLCLGLRVTV